MSDELNSVVSMATLDTVDTDCITFGALAGQTAVEVVHGVGVVAGDGEQTFARLEGVF